MRISVAALAAVAMVPLALFGDRAGPSLSLGGAALALFGGRAGPSLSLGGAALAHGDAPRSEPGAGEWIMRGQHRSQAGEWCYGEGDCAVVRGVHTVSLPGPGYRLPAVSSSRKPQGRSRPSATGYERSLRRTASSGAASGRTAAGGASSRRRRTASSRRQPNSRIEHGGDRSNGEAREIPSAL